MWSWCEHCGINNRKLKNEIKIYKHSDLKINSESKLFTGAEISLFLMSELFNPKAIKYEKIICRSNIMQCLWHQIMIQMFVMLYGKKKIKTEDFSIIYSIESAGWSVAYCVKFHRDKHITSRLAGIICSVKEGWTSIISTFLPFLWLHTIQQGT